MRESYDRYMMRKYRERTLSKTNLEQRVEQLEDMVKGLQEKVEHLEKTKAEKMVVYENWETHD